MRRSLCWPQSHQDVLRTLVERASNGRRMLLIHGDEVDSSVRYGQLRVRIGAVSYSAALSLDRVVRWSEVRARAGAQRPLRLLGSSKA